MRTGLGICVLLAMTVTATASLAADPYGAPFPTDPPNFSAPDSGAAYGVPGAFNWSGFYLGVQGGYGWGSAKNASPDGGLAGGTLGINGQFGQVVYGAEADGSWAGLEGSDGRRTFEMQGLGTIRGRVGFAFDRFVAYGTGGGAITSLDVSSARASDSKLYFGWTVGAGLEAALTGNFSAKVEYLYADFGTESFSVRGARDVDLSANMLRAGINYRF